MRLNRFSWLFIIGLLYLSPDLDRNYFCLGTCGRLWRYCIHNCPLAIKHRIVIWICHRMKCDIFTFYAEYWGYLFTDQSFVRRPDQMFDFASYADQNESRVEVLDALGEKAGCPIFYSKAHYPSCRLSTRICIM